MSIFKEKEAKDIKYNGSVSGLTAENVQDAIDEVSSGAICNISTDENFAGDGTALNPLTFKKISTNFGIGNNQVLDSFADTLGNYCVWEYVVSDGTNSRGGTVTLHWNATTNQITDITDTSTEAIGTLNFGNVEFDADIQADAIRLLVNSTLASFTFTAIRRISE